MKYAFAIGLNAVDPAAYGGWDGILNACENDALCINKIAMDRGFEQNYLLSSEATVKNVMETIYRLADTAVAGDLVLIHYSGHGGQVPDLSGEEKDGLDETWCLYDGMLLDDDLNFALAKFKKGVRVVVLSDSCHSGTVIKMAFMNELGGATSPKSRVKAAPQLVCREYTKANPVVKAAKRPRVRASVILISGCQDNQFSYDGATNGLFTGTLLQVYNNGQFKLGYRDFRKAIVKKMPPEQTPQLLTMGAKDKAFENITPVFYAE